MVFDSDKKRMNRSIKPITGKTFVSDYTRLSA